MDANLLQLIRFVHIVSASVWVGIAVTLAFFVNPTLLDGSIDGARTMKAIMMRRKLVMWLLFVVLLAIASGLRLYRIDFPHLSSATFDRRALDYTLGGFFAITAFIVGITINIPTGRKIAALADAVGPGSPTAEQNNELVRLSRRLIIASRSTAILTLGAAALMALARYAT